MEEVIKGLLHLRDCNYAAARGVRLLGEYFNAADIGGSGGMTMDQVLKIFGSQEVREKLEDIKLDNPDWAVLFEELDVDGSGDLSWEEISDGMTMYWQNESPSFDPASSP
mmetsp:Transcript_38196/g.118645  ORF Transcript_38196/g.118645 Transcript_38196/m.118645 type:complete len:110 (-) Transcript_38196:269-598(-)